MRKLIVLMLMAVLVSQSMSAQNRGRQRMTAEQRTEMSVQMLDRKLSLTDEQKTRIRDLYTDFYKQDTLREKRKEAMEKLSTDITAVLTPEQQTLYKQMREEMANRRQQRPHRNGPTENTL